MTEQPILYGMATALFFGLPVHGHTNPTLPLVSELVRRGEAIMYYSTEPFAGPIAATGATYRAYRNAFLPELGSIARQLDELAWLFVRTTAELLETELDAYRAERPDYVLTDSVAPWGQWVGELLGVPVVTSVSTFAFNRHVMRYGTSHGVRPQSARQFLSKLRHIAKAVRLRARLQRQYGVRGPTLMGTISGHSALTLVYTSREFQPCAETFDDRYRFVGPLLGPRPGEQPFDWDRLPAATVVYVSLGTLFNADEAFYRQCFEAFAGAPYSVVLAVGGRIRLERLGAPPPNVRIFPHVPQLEVLGRASAFVTHGGMNSVSESLMSGVPMVVIPQMSEQAIVGRRAEELGAALFLAKTDVTPARLRASVARLLEVSDFTRSAAAIGRSLREAGGVARAADEVLMFTRRQTSLAAAGAVAAGP
jgi:MGT family glycosyltransferase